LRALGAKAFARIRRAKSGRNAMPWFYLLIAIVAEVVGTSALKASAGMTKLAPAAIVVAGYGVAFYLLSLTLDQIPVGVAYAIWSGVGIVLISLIGWRFFDQTLDTPALLGMGLIVAGVAVINLFSKSAAH
jgi:small multidrug resistance pump